MAMTSVSYRWARAALFSHGESAALPDHFISTNKRKIKMASWTFPAIVESCKASVHLTANQHLSYYDPLDRYIDEDANRDKDDQMVSPEQRKRIIAAGVIYELQFYPDSPVGFYRVYGTTMDEVVAAAGAILDEQTL